ncbi:hypothetical protein BN7_1194 [Wickerhamomyces ciferrii]|uniref:Uncharacterized protein n=1 Tax=Wickerhamomyces ciferrii (strain ATCC 14091 / BCRC 22168 / CBS 111 / JCM 3599 / NBRC 0793 / NRRL Y-1031 F-60-10) TaxID=1206466 RepID=K0KKK7_WICCF|nr:uncharacterized protein BN7_1194 [Wickerhamomyces ciferrii]CCH41653.1 hypothetical protein BN7_1194 [Wickerhamomyces ciferrii]
MRQSTDLILLWEEEKSRVTLVVAVLVGNGLSVLFTAARLMELYNKVGLRILILETNSLDTFQVGPLPYCLTSIPYIPSSLLQDAAINNTESSIMFLMTIHRASKRSIPKAMNKPVSNESLIVRPCTHPTNSISYNPQLYINYLRHRLLNFKNISFAKLANKWDLEKIIDQLPKDIPNLIFTLENESVVKLNDLSLSSVHWDGIANWKMPEYAHWIKKHKNSNCKVNQIIIKGNPIFQIISNHNSFDLCGAISGSEIITGIIDQHIINSKLRWPRL